MMGIIAKIMLQVLSTLAVATEEINQGRASELISEKWPLLTLTYVHLEKYMKKLLGKNDIEDSLNSLDTLTQEEARMAVVEVWRIANSVNTNVNVILEGALSIPIRSLTLS